MRNGFNGHVRFHVMFLTELNQCYWLKQVIVGNVGFLWTTEKKKLVG